MPLRALVTGVRGFIGRHFAAELRERGYEVAGCDPLAGTDALDWFARDDPYVSDGFDLVIHAAARSPHRVAIDTAPGSHIYNAHLDAAMFEWALRTLPGRVAYLSSCAAADADPDDYGLLKLTGERMARQARAYGVPVTVVRPYSGYGSDQSEDFPFGAFIARAKRREDPFAVWGDGTQVRDWVHVDDIVGATLALVEAGVDGPVDICTGAGISMLELAELVCTTAGYCPTIECRLDAPAGARRRVGDPDLMSRFYSPKVDLAEGIRRAL